MKTHVRKNKATGKYEIWITNDNPDQKYRYRVNAFGTTPLPICSDRLSTEFETAKSAEQFVG